MGVTPHPATLCPASGFAISVPPEPVDLCADLSGLSRRAAPGSNGSAGPITKVGRARPVRRERSTLAGFCAREKVNGGPFRGTCVAPGCVLVSFPLLCVAGVLLAMWSFLRKRRLAAAGDIVDVWSAGAALADVPEPGALRPDLTRLGLNRLGQLL